MSKQKRNPPRTAKMSPAHIEQRRRELEWQYGEKNEQHLEFFRKSLIFAWLLSCFALAFTMNNDKDLIVWAGAAGVALVVTYQIRVLWLNKRVEDYIDAELGPHQEE
ncbi:MAG: hypothetical protein EPN21_11755 [Methylococcaceae bacterium]|nr:MAG: hypothetical protein EPN21_11755 [Methylococcaceae bacterium]